MKTFSICVPVYTMKGGLCERFLIEYLSHLLFQTYRDFEVIVSDQSNDVELKNICDIFSKVLDIKYVVNTSKIKNAASNVNNAVRHASGEIVKLLYVDDFFVDEKALEKIKNAFDANENLNWLISGFTHSDQQRTKYFRTRIPRYDQKFVNGDNSTGNPSNYSVRRKYAIEMDENLLWVVDGEYFYRTFYYHGDPIMIKDVLVCFREHESSAFKSPELSSLEAEERLYCTEKYSKMLPTNHK